MSTPEERRLDRLRRTPPELLQPVIYLVVCDTGFARGVFDDNSGSRNIPTMPELYDCARLRNSLCVCRGKHKIVRAVQTGTGAEVQ